MYKAIIIEDEKIAQNRLKRLLEKYPFIKVIETANNGREGAELTNLLKPDLIFLDIQMPVLNGFEMLKSISHQPKIIFTTAYDQYALQAFEENSIDYLLKPISEERLDKAIEKLKALGTEKSDSQQIEALLTSINLLNKPKKPDSITITNGDKIILLPFSEVAYFQAEDKYAFAYTLSGKRHILDFSLTKLEEKIPDKFLRIHRAVIMNADAIAEIRKGFGGKFFFKMKNNTQIESGVTYNQTIKAFLNL